MNKNATVTNTKITNQKAYKLRIINNFRIFPGDPTGSPDDFFLGNYLKIWGFSQLIKKEIKNDKSDSI